MDSDLADIDANIHMPPKSKRPVVMIDPAELAELRQQLAEEREQERRVCALLEASNNQLIALDERLDAERERTVKAETERDRLRDALEEITKGTPFSTRSKDGEFLRELARDALAAIKANDVS